MASMTISRGTPFSAASWVMAVTNSLFMLACPSALVLLASGPHNKRSGGYPLLSVASAAARSGRARTSISPRMVLCEAIMRDGLAGFDPLAVTFDEVHQAVVGDRFGDAFFDDLFADVEVDVTG